MKGPLNIREMFEKEFEGSRAQQASSSAAHPSKTPPAKPLPDSQEDRQSLPKKEEELALFCLKSAHPIPSPDHRSVHVDSSEKANSSVEILFAPLASSSEGKTSPMSASDNQIGGAKSVQSCTVAKKSSKQFFSVFLDAQLLKNQPISAKNMVGDNPQSLLSRQKTLEKVRKKDQETIINFANSYPKLSNSAEVSFSKIYKHSGEMKIDYVDSLKQLINKNGGKAVFNLTSEELEGLSEEALAKKLFEKFAFAEKE